MAGDIVAVTATMTPGIPAAVGAYDGAVLAKARDEAADTAAGLGRRLLRQVFGRVPRLGPGFRLPAGPHPAARVRTPAGHGSLASTRKGNDAIRPAP